jgi:hypothetical protein
MNWDTSSLLNVVDASGTIIASNVVAVVFAPGPVIGSQNRTPNGAAPLCGGNYTAADYLDSDGTVNNAAVSGTASAISTIRAASTVQYNDQLIFITRDDIFNARNFAAKLDTLTREVAKCIAYFGTKNTSPGPSNKSLPWPGKITLFAADYFINDQYNDDDNTYAGRVPYKVNTSRDDSGGNSITSDYLLQSNGANCPSGWAATYPWWDNWKDHLFYGIGEKFEPNSGATGSCSSSTCLKINGAGSYAAVIMFAGRKLSGQTRDDRSIVAKYLEGNNATNLSGSASGSENYQTATPSPTFNDILYCIDQNLNVNPC